MSTAAIPRRTPVLADSIPGARARDLGLVLAGAAFIAVA
ncbi:MAG: biotin transporter BioY, partial [Microbacteriaceae bacterium]|nr:biotin transporter BioY [Microbacteriaceae bacterium]